MHELELVLLVDHLTTRINPRLAVIVQVEVLLLGVIHIALRHTGGRAGAIGKHLIGICRYQGDTRRVRPCCAGTTV